ncbi:MAG: Peptidase family M23 [Candidatus Electronema aureum]|uniref:Peptidase family M23 n=1 Tax=Candidatus Electronema aureum TaxID=2005002 RepID=A0A521G2L8_9BACT|nr:MAG: Peptidase family M23 [Candidatus Electronema aureum]
MSFWYCKKLLLLPCLLLLATPAHATQGNVLAKGIIYQAATYINHPQFGTHPSYYGNRPEQVVDINIGPSSADDEGMPLFAPEDGSVTIIHYNTNRWGYSLEWRNRSNTERIFFAHLKSIKVIGAVRAGQQIAEIGSTGGWKPHLHIESSQGWLELSGRILQPPINPYGNGMFFASNGPVPAARPLARQFITMPLENRIHSVELGGGQFYIHSFNLQNSK